MTRSNGSFTGSLVSIAQKSFVAGCFGCLGAGSTGVIVFLLVSVVFQAQFAALLKTISLPTIPSMPTTVAAGELQAIEIFVAKGNDANAEHVAQVQLPIRESLFLCVRGPKGASVHFTVRITLPNGQTKTFGSGFVSDPSGEIVCLGILSDLLNLPGVFRIDAMVDTTVVGSTVLTVIP